MTTAVALALMLGTRRPDPRDVRRDLRRMRGRRTFLVIEDSHLVADLVEEHHHTISDAPIPAMGVN